MLHLHRLDHGDLLASQHLVAFRDVDADDRALNRRDDARGALGPGFGLCSAFRTLGGPCLRRLGRLVVREESERIDVVDPGARKAAVAGFFRPAGGRCRAATVSGRDEALPPAVAGGRRQLLGVVVEPAGVEVAGGKVRMAEDALQPGDVRRGSSDPELVERPRGALHRVAEVVRGRVGDHFGQERVERRVRLVAGVAAAVDPHARAARGLVSREDAGGRPHGALGVQRLQVDPRLDRKAARADGFRLSEPETGKRLAGGDPQLCLHQVDAGDRFGHRVLHLQAGVRFDEGEAAARIGGRATAIAAVAAPSGKGEELVGKGEELERAQAVVPRGAAEAQRGVDDRGAQGGGEIGRRCCLNHFLVPALGAAFAFA